MKNMLRFLLQSTLVLAIGVAVSGGLVYFMPTSLKQSEANFSRSMTAQLVPNEKITALKESVLSLNNQSVVNILNAKKNLLALKKDDGVAMNVSPSLQHLSPEAQQLVRVSEVGKCLKAARETQGFKIADLQAATGLTEAQIMNIESGKTVITPDVASDLEPFLKAQISFTK